MTVKLTITIFLISLLCIAGCVRRTIVQDFGIIGQPPERAASSPDNSLRAVFQQQQKNGAVDPLVDDPRIRAAQNRLKQRPEDVEAYFQLAELYEGYRLYEQALTQYTEAFRIAGSETAMMGIVRSDQALNRPWHAIPLLEQYLTATPSAAGWNALGQLYDASKDLAGGEKALRQAVGIDPALDQWRNDLGFNLLLQGKTDAAEAEFRKALELNPKSLRSHNNLGMVLARRGDLGGALEEFRFAADDATAHNNLAVVLMEMGRYEESREELVKSLAIRRYFAPALANFKLVQDRLRVRAEQQKQGSLPQSKVRVASAEPESIQMK
jgi:tetratricopeptide (TPR) repeat protein